MIWRWSNAVFQPEGEGGEIFRNHVIYLQRGVKMRVRALHEENEHAILEWVRRQRTGDAAADMKGPGIGLLTDRTVSCSRQ